MWDAPQDTRDSICTFLLCCVGMQSWYRPQCHQSGPNNVLYTSIILNCFIIYAFLRLVHQIFQDWAMKYRSSFIDEKLRMSQYVPIDPVFFTADMDSALVGGSKKSIVDSISDKNAENYGNYPEHRGAETAFSPMSKQQHIHTLTRRTWKAFFADCVTVGCYNRPGLVVGVSLITMMILFYEGIFFVQLFQCYFKNALTFVPYFFGGAAAASMLEIIHYLQWLYKPIKVSNILYNIISN